MNYIGIAVLLVAMIFSWRLPFLEKDPSLAVHLDIQNEIVDLIREAALSQLPGADTVQMKKIWTEATNASEVLVEFHYAIFDKLGEALESNRGVAKVSKKDSALWSVHSVKINSTTVNFQDGMTISPNE